MNRTERDDRAQDRRDRKQREQARKAMSAKPVQKMSAEEQARWDALPRAGEVR